MSCHECGSDAGRCGCCSGIATLTPASVENRPALSSLTYRVGTHGAFLSSMKARLPSIEIVAPGSDHQTLQSFRPLRTLTTRDPSDPAIALLDAWATVADVLTFYQERIANEGYVRTATERFSLVELARLVGYAPRPGVSASVHLSYTVDDNQAEPVELPVGTRAQSLAGPGELPQTFETGESLLARREWNDLQIRRQRPQNIVFSTITTLERVHVVGTETGAQPGDLVLFRFGQAAGAMDWVRRVAKVEIDFAAQRSALLLQPLPATMPEAVQLLMALVDDLHTVPGGATPLVHARALLADVAIDALPPVREWVDRLRPGADGEAMTRVERFGQEVAALAPPMTETPSSTPDAFVGKLLEPPKVQARNTLRLPRSLAATFRKGSDALPQLVVSFAPRLKASYYQAWRGSTPPRQATTGTQSGTIAGTASAAEPPKLESVHLLRSGEPLFGAAAGLPTPQLDGRTVPALETWDDWTYARDETQTNAFLAKAEPSLEVGSLVLVVRPEAEEGTEVADKLEGLRPRKRVLRVGAVRSGPRQAYGMSGESTRVEFDFGPMGTEAGWRAINAGRSRLQIRELRGTWFHLPRCTLTLTQEPIDEPVWGAELELGVLHEQLASGRWVVVEGERSDIEGVRGVRASELLMVAGLQHGYDEARPGDRTHTTLRLATAMAYRYRREGLRIHGNVVSASHGETRREVLGSGDARKPGQRFVLRQPPLTWRPAPTAAGAASTLKVLVNDIEWREVDSLAGQPPDARVFVTATDDDDRTTVAFGDGERGLRPPSGFENVRAEYRNGIGHAGNVRPGQIGLMIDRPLGMKEVVNPLRGSSGADRESAALIRDNAPRSSMALDRLVSLSDYADFTRMYAGIAKAVATRLSDGTRERVHITVAGIDDMPIDETSDLYRNLVESLHRFGDPGLTVQVAMRERVALVLEARLRLLPGFRWEPVVAQVRERVLERFGFAARPLAQPALLCEVIAAIQSVRGIDWVDVEHFGGIPETERKDDRRVLISQEGIRAAMGRILATDQTLATAHSDPLPPRHVDAGAAEREGSSIRAARLAYFTPDIPDALILNPVE